MQTTYEDDIYQIPSMVQTTQQTEDVQQADTITNLVIIRRHILDMNGLTLPSENKANSMAPPQLATPHLNAVSLNDVPWYYQDVRTQ